MDLPLWRQNVDNCSRTFPDASVVAVKDGHIVGAVIGKNPNKISTIFVAPEFRRQGIGTELLERAEVAFTGELETSLIAGQDDKHFFPGIPDEAVAAKSFFTARGFHGQDGSANDMIRSLTDWVAPTTKPAVARALKDNRITLLPCTVDLVPSLLNFVSVEFSDRWLRDTRDRISAEPDPGEIVVAVENGVDVIGFSHTWSVRSQVIGSPIYWRSLLGPHFGGLGPIGVAAHRRKIGLGLELLNYSISQVATGGATAMVIDWTGIVDFYAKSGFKVWKRYSSFNKTF